MLQGHVRVHESANRTQISHVGAKPFFTAIGEEGNRNRRWRQPFPVKIKLMGLDFVLARQEHHLFSHRGRETGLFCRWTRPGSRPPSAADLPSPHGRTTTYVISSTSFRCFSPARRARLRLWSVSFCGWRHGVALGVRYLFFAVQGVVQSARPIRDHLCGCG